MGTKNHTGSSPEEETDVKSGSADSSSAEGVNSDSPSGQAPSGEEEEETLSSIIEGAMNGDDDDDDGSDDNSESDQDTLEDDPDGKPAESPDDEGDAKGEEPGGNGKQEGGDADQDDDGKDVEPGQKVPYDRFQKVIQQRNELREQTESLREGYERDQKLTNYMREHNISGQEVSDALKFMTLLRVDPAKALEQIQPVVSQLNQYVGRELPEDIRARVESGELDERDAVELVKSRNEADRLRRLQAEQHQNAERETQEQQVARLRKANGMAADEEVAALRKSDPDFKQKEPWLETEVRALLQIKPPRSPEDARALVKEAYDNVTERLRGTLRGTRRSQRREVDSSQGGSGPRAGEAEPESMGEAIQQAWRVGN